MFDVVFLIIWILVILGLVLYLFYWNRVLGFLLSLLARVLSWNQASASTWIDIGSIQFSILAGRILFKDLRYHTSNQTIRLVKGQLSWRYWIRKPTEEDELRHARVGAEDVGRKATWPLACRVHLSVQGAEWFLYNRTAAYEDIISQMSGEPLHRSYTAETQQSTALPKEPDYDYPPRTLTGSGSLLAGAPSVIRRTLEWVSSQLPRIEFNDLLPISVEIEKGAIICGNPSTPSLLVAEYTKAEGTYGIVPSRSKCDLYKKLLSVKFHNASIHYVVNSDYASPMVSTGEELHDRIHRSQVPRRHLASYFQYDKFLKFWRRLSLSIILTSLSRPSHPRPTTQSSFRSRKTDTNAEDDTPVGADFSVLEYAVERKILEAPILELSYYADVVGLVPHQAQDTPPNPSDPFDIGNGDIPPEWGFDLVIRNGFLRYGPWADRQRVELQRAFFPPVYQNSSPTSRLRPGDTRVWPSMKIFVELRDTTTLQIPFREASKDWQWDGQVEYRRPRKREAASFFLKAGENSTINCILPMVVGPGGYEPVLEVILDTVTLTSSMNDYQLLSAESCSVRSTMPSPLQWNGRRQWDFHICLRKAVMYLIREHINMFTDLGKDWSAGPPSDYHRFTPMVYAVDLELRAFQLNAYINDHNIIDKPSIREENGLLTVGGISLQANMEIDSTTFRPVSSVVPFSITAPDLSVSLTLPRWNTHSMNPRPEIGSIGELAVTGSYRYFHDVRPDNVDRLRLNIDAKNLVLKTFGWVIRHFMVLRDNYFGSFTQFHTLYEYIQKKDRGLPISDPTELKYRPGKSNLFEVVLEVNINQNLFLLPARLPGFDAPPELQDPNPTSPGLGPSLIISVPNIQVHLRTHDYVMEMSLNAEPLSGSIVDDFPNISPMLNPRLSYGCENLFIDGFNIIANRLFGPQPKTSTYFCIWEIHIGRVKSCLSTPQANVIIAALRSFDSGFDDALDAPAKEVSLPLDPDVTFLKVAIDNLDLVWKAGGAALHLCAPWGVRIDFNDLAGKTYKKVNSIRLRKAILKLLLASGPNRSSWLEAAHVEIDCCIDMYKAQNDWQEAARKQARFIVEQDAPTGRARQLIMLHGWTEEFRHEPTAGYKAKEFQYTELRLPVVRDPDPVGAGNELWIHEEERSESENDEPISPAIRDARLAKSRPVTPLTSPMYLSESSMASGDESDDEDLTEPDDCDSDVEDGNQQVVLLMSRYRKCTRIYWRNTQKVPSSWGDAAYQMLKDRTPLVEPYTNCNRNVPSNDGNMLAVGQNQGSNAGKTIIRVRVEHGIQVSLNSLVTPAVASLVQDTVMNRPSPELYLDAVIQGYISSFSDENVPEELSTNLLDVQLPSVQMSYLHILPSAKLEGRSHAYMNMILLSLSGLRFSGGISPLLCLSATVGGASVSVLSAPRPTSAQPRALLCRVSGLDLETCRVSAHSGVLACHISSLTSTFSQHSPFHVATVSASLASCIKKIHSQHFRWRSQSSSITKQTVKHILQAHQGRDVLDPLFAHRPAYLVHRGKPYRLRQDSSFRFLFRLRYLLGQLDAVQRKEIDAFTPNVTIPLEDLVTLLAGASDDGPLADPDTSDSQDIAVLRLLFPEYPSPSTGIGGDDPQIRSFIFSLDHLGVDVWDSGNRSCNEVVVKSLVVSCGGRSSTLIQPTLSRSPAVKERQQRNALRHIVASIAVSDCMITIFPHALDFAQQVLSAVHIHHPPSAAPLGSPSVSVESLPHQERKATSIDVVFNVRGSSLRAATEKLIIEFQANGLTVASSVLLEPSASDAVHAGSATSMNHSLLFSKVALRACAAGVPEAQDQHVLASLNFENGRFNAALRQEQLSSMASRIVLSLGALELSVPRSAMRLYKFAEEWRADYLPGLEKTMRTVVSEARRKPESQKQKKPSKPVTIHLNALFPSIRVSLQVMHGTWLAWEMVNTVAFFRSSAAARLKKAYSFGIQARQQVFSISSQPHWLHGLRKRTRVKFAIPMISIQGKFDGSEVQAMVLVEFFDLTFRPSHWDTVLTVQQKFGQDFSDLISLVNEKRTATTPNTESTPLSPGPPASSRIKFGGVIKMKGFRIGLEGPSSVLFLECRNIGGGMQENYGRSWKLSVQDLALSLAPNTHSKSGLHSFDRIDKTAFVSIDFHVSTNQSTSSSAHTLDITVTKVHAVMQPSSIGQLGDFLDHIQAELKLRAEQRAKELAAFKEKTREFIKTFESSKPGPDAIQSWISGFLINFTFKNIGIAFPLDFDPTIRVERPESGKDRATRAFLLSIKSLSFSLQRGESGQAVMKGTALQFVSGFRQSVPSDFIEENHQTRNKLFYPEMTAQVKTDRPPDSRTLRFKADVSGFILDIDSSIPVFIFSLIDVYQKGKERFDRMAESIEAMPRSFSSFDATPRIPLASLEPHYDSLPTSNVVGSLIFHSGKVRLYCDATPTYSRIRSISMSGHGMGEDSSLLEASADVFDLPEVSVWAEYRARSASGKVRDLGDPSMLMFKSTIHSSSNVFKPTFLPFLRELVDHVETRLNRSSPTHTKGPSTLTPRLSSSPLIPYVAVGSPGSVARVQVIFSLRIDQSKLELTCQPDANVIAGVHWESGGFVVNVSPGFEQVAFTGSVGGLSVGLKHGFLSEDCVHLNANNLSFNITIAGSEYGGMQKALSVVMDTEFTGGVRFSRLQDILCFKAVWLDRIPVFTTRNDSPASSIIENSPVVTIDSSHQHLDTAVLVRLRCVKLDVDFGQSISSTNIEFNEGVLRTKITSKIYEFSLEVAKSSIKATGNISGHGSVPDFLFRTKRKKDRARRTVDVPEMLNLTMTSGPLDLIIESDHQRILRYRAEPIQVMIFDDWTMISPIYPEANRKLRLSFTLVGKEVVLIATVETVPQLVSYANKFSANMEAQREGALRESKAFRISASPKPDNPLSDVANAMFQSARSKFKEAEGGLTHAIRQQMSLRLETLRLVIFPRTMHDHEMAHFLGSGIHAKLDRVVELESSRPKRDLELSFASLTISKLNQTGYSSYPPRDNETASVYILDAIRRSQEAIIFGLPSMKIKMVTNEEKGQGLKKIHYDFASKFLRREGMADAEDIFITLNLALYSWLTILRKNFTKEMNQVQAAAERPVPPPNLKKVAKTVEGVPDDLGIPSIIFSSESIPFPPASPPIEGLPSAPVSASTNRSFTSSPINSPTPPQVGTPGSTSNGIEYIPQHAFIEKLTMRQLGEATPDVMHPFFMKKAGFNLEESLPQYVHEYATLPTEEIMKALLRLYSKQLKTKHLG